MKIKTPMEFLTFNDGYCFIYSVKGNQLADRKAELRYGNRTLGMRRHYAARTAGVEINRLIQVPQNLEINTHDNAVIDGNRYSIEQAQYISDSNPPVTLLTLRKIGGVA